MSNQKHCRSCRYLDFNAMSDEMYCKLKDYEQIRLRWHKNRPDWCPLIKRKQLPEPYKEAKQNDLLFIGLEAERFERTRRGEKKKEAGEA